MKNRVSVKWENKLHFHGILDERIVPIDAVDPEDEGSHGIRPKGLLLMALGGCTGIDVASILQKMREDFTSFEVNVSATPDLQNNNIYESFQISYLISGKELHTPKIVRAVRMSMNTYCGVSQMLEKVGPVEYEIIVNGVKLDLDKFETDSDKKSE